LNSKEFKSLIDELDRVYNEIAKLYNSGPNSKYMVVKKVNPEWKKFLDVSDEHGHKAVQTDSYYSFVDVNFDKLNSDDIESMETSNMVTKITDYVIKQITSKNKDWKVTSASYGMFGGERGPAMVYMKNGIAYMLVYNVCDHKGRDQAWIGNIFLSNAEDYGA
jgi:hypothetical protein